MLSAAALDGQILKNCYQIEKRVGKGGMAWVYKARHIMLNVPVAIKILLPSLAEEASVRQRFIMEAKVMFQLRHPHIVQVTDIIQEGDIIGMVMEWVDGEDLNQWLKRQSAQISWKQFWTMGAPLLGAMDYIHRKGFIHRDLKLSNIMLHYEGSETYLKVADFGLVKMLDDMAEEHLTQTGTRMGTVAYMSPEQIKDAKSVGFASDIYSLGVVLYKLLTRKLPFTGDVHYVIYQHIDATPPSMREHREDIPPAIDDVVMRCLAKRPEDRWESCAALAQALRNALLESQCLEESQARMFHVSADPEAAEHTWHSTSPKRFSNWDETQPEWMREQAYNSHLHRSQSGLTLDATGGALETTGDIASEVTRIGEAKPLAGSKVPWVAVAAILVFVATSAVGVWWYRQKNVHPVVTPQPRMTTTIQPPPQRLRVATTIPQRRVETNQTQPGLKHGSRDQTPEPRRTQPSPNRRILTQHRPDLRRRRVRRRRLIPSTLVIESSPRGAEVWKDSRRLGKTPYQWKGKPGEKIHWTLKMRGFEPKSGRWKFSRTRLAKNHYQLKPRMVELMIRSEPSGASVLIDGRPVGKTPYRYRGQQGSKVSLAIKKENYTQYKGSVRLLAEKKTKFVKLKPFLNDPFQ